MKTVAFRVFIIVSCLIVLAVGAVADVPNNLTVTSGTLQWVWADPCAALEPSCNLSGHDLTLTNGWTLPTNAQWLASFVDTNDVYTAFNITNGYLCGSAYFDSGYSHCDAPDVQAGAIWNAPAPIGDPFYYSNPNSDSFLVRSTVPEPSSMLLFGSGMLGLFGVIRRKINL